MAFLLETLKLGLANLALHKLRSLLTALGIIFGVAAVITMVAIGEGNKQKALADIRLLGARNVIVRSVKPPAPTSLASGGENQRRMLDYGIRRLDLRRIESTVGGLRRIVPLKQVGSTATHGPHRAPAEVFGTTPDLIDVASLHLSRGRYLTDEDLARLENVAVIGHEVAQRLFPLADPLDEEVRIEGQAFKVVGVLAPVGGAGGAGATLVGRDLNFDVHVPLPTATARFGDVMTRRESGSFERTRVELSFLYLEALDEDDVPSIAEQVALVLDQGHGGKSDTSLIVPRELLEQQARTLAMFNALMTAIAAISLLVGGIGIMNIMLVSVTERTREIGVRRALGATRRHIIGQFLAETTLLSAIGGLIGVALGPLGAFAVYRLTTLSQNTASAIGQPIVTTWSIVVSFAVATGVGIAFGVYPALRAAYQDPIVALRHD